MSYKWSLKDHQEVDALSAGAFPSSARIVARAITGVVRIAYSFAAVAYAQGHHHCMYYQHWS